MTRTHFSGRAFAMAMLAGVTLSPAAHAINHRPALEDSDVRKLAELARQELVKAHSSGCVVIADPDGMPLYLERQVDAFPNCLSAALAKAKSAALFEKPTNQDYLALQKGQMTTLVVPHLSPNPGGLPLRAEGIVVGSISISTPDGDIDQKVVEATVAGWSR